MPHEPPPDSEDDHTLFQRAMQGVLPLKSRLTQIAPTPRPRRPPQRIPDLAPSKQSATTTALSHPIENTLHADSVVCFGQERVHHKQLHKLKRGLLPIQARCDLHGLSREEARHVMQQFIINQTHQGRRCVLIIHGKGGRYTEHSVLKSHVVHWLTQLPPVLAFHSAAPQHGGNGAVCVLLKQQHKSS